MQTVEKTAPSVDGNVCPHQSHILHSQKRKKKNNENNFLWGCELDPCGGQAADEGDTAEAHPPEEGGTGRLHDEVLQKNSQFCEQGAEEQTSSV